MGRIDRVATPDGAVKALGGIGGAGGGGALRVCEGVAVRQNAGLRQARHLGSCIRYFLWVFGVGCSRRVAFGAGVCAWG